MNELCCAAGNNPFNDKTETGNEEPINNIHHISTLILGKYHSRQSQHYNCLYLTELVMQYYAPNNNECMENILGISRSKKKSMGIAQ